MTTDAAIPLHEHRQQLFGFLMKVFIESIPYEDVNPEKSKRVIINLETFII